MPLLDDYCKEINLHVRHIAQLLVAWYTFFVTANLVAAGWFVTTDTTRARIGRPVLYVVIAVLVLVNLLGVAAMRFIQQYFMSADRDLLRLLQHTSSAEGEALPLIEITPIPLLLYRRMLQIITVSLLAISATWVAIGFDRVS